MQLESWLTLAAIGFAAILGIILKKASRPRVIPHFAPRATGLDFLPFKDNDAFFTYQCRYGVTDIALGRAIVGQVLHNATKLAAEAMPTSAPAGQVYLIKLASNSGTEQTFAACGQPDVYLRPGDLVAWMPVRYIEALGKWHGVIFAKLAPEIRHGELVPTSSFIPT